MAPTSATGAASTGPAPAEPATRGILPRSLVRGLLIAVGILNTVSAIAGGIGLLTPGAMGLPLELIEPFTSYVWPAALLLVVIGGTQGLAVLSELRRWRTAAFWGAFAGLALIIWIFVQLAIMGDYSPLHGIFFVTGVAQLALVIALLDVVPGLVGGSRRSIRSPGTESTR
jgi:hypothetical protein